MTFTQTWPTDYKDQVAYMKSLLAFTQTQDANSGVCGLAQDTSPTSGELAAAWQTYIGDNRAVPPGAKIQWWDTVRGVLDQVWTATKDVGGVGSTANLYPMSPKKKTLDIGVIAAATLQTAAAISAISLAGASADWTHLMISAQVRWDAIVTIAGSWKTQNAGALAYTERITVNGGVAGRTSSGQDAQFMLQAAPVVGNTDQPFLSSFIKSWMPHVFNATMDKICLGASAVLTQVAALPIVTGARFAVIAGGSINDIAALTSLSFASTATIPVVEAGSSYCIYGLRG